MNGPRTVLGCLLCAGLVGVIGLADGASTTDGGDVDEDEIRLLIVTGEDHPAHDWRTSTPTLREVLSRDPRFDVRVVEDPHFLESSALESYDVLVLHFMNWMRPDPPERARSNLEALVKRGKGLVVVHFACGAFGEWAEYRNLAGKVWDRKNGHDPRGPFEVKVLDTGHSVTEGLGSFRTDDELYTCLEGERRVDLLAVARSKVTGRDHPMAFSFSYGGGRVFHTPLGHDARAIRNAGTAELLRRGCAWAASREPTVSARTRGK